MTVLDLIARLGSAGIRLWLEDDQLKFKAPKGALTPELRDALVAMKPQVIDFLRQTRTQGDNADRIPQAATRDSAPMTFSQRGVWFVEQLAPGNSTFHIPSALYLRGILDRDALRIAFEQVLARHDALRSVFDASVGEPVVRVLPPRPFVIPYEDLSAQTLEEQASATRRIAEACIREPFDLLRGPLVRAKLIRLDDHLHGLVVVMHHLVSDGWSMDVFTREIAVLYGAARQGLPSPLPALDIQYGDFAHWQAGWLAGETLERQVTFWRDTLSGCHDPIALPHDRPRPMVQTGNGAAFPFVLASSQAEAVRALARRHETTPYVILLAAYAMVLSRWSGDDDINIGMPVAGRTRTELEGLIGFFVNMLVIRTRLDTLDTVDALISHVRDQVLAAQSHQDIPFDTIVDRLAIPRQLSHAPLFQVGFSFVSMKESTQPVIGGLEIEPMPVELAGARSEITLMLVDNGKDFRGIIEYNRDLFDASTMQRFAQHFSRVVSLLPGVGQQRPDGLPFESDEQLGQRFNIEGNGRWVTPTAVQRDILLDTQFRNDASPLLVSLLVTGQDESECLARLSFLLADQPVFSIRWLPADQPWLDVALGWCPGQPALRTLEKLMATSDKHARELVRERAQGLLSAATTPVVAGIVELPGGDVRLWVAVHPVVTDLRHLTELVSTAANGAIPLPRNHRDWSAACDALAVAQQDARHAIDAPSSRSRAALRLAQTEPVLLARDVTGAAFHDVLTLSAETWLHVRDVCHSSGITARSLFTALFGLTLQATHHCPAPLALVCLRDLAGSSTLAHNTLAAALPVIPALEEMASLDFVELARRIERETDGEALSFATASRLVGRESVMLQVQHVELPDTPVCSLQWNVPIAPGALRLLIIAGSDGLRVELSGYEAESVNRQWLNRWHSALVQLLAGTRRCRDIEWCLEGERDRLLTAWQGTVRPLPSRPVTAAIDASIARFRDRSAVIKAEKTLSYAELDSLANRVAFWLVAVAGVRKGDRVGLCFGKSLMLPVAVLGAVRAGAVYVPMDAGYPDDRLAFLLTDSGAQAFIGDAARLASLGSVPVRHVLPLASAADVSGYPGAAIPLELSPTDGLYMVYTSGSTGVPKGAGVCHAGEVNLLEWYVGDLGLDENDRALMASAFGFDLTQKNIFAMLGCGGAIVMPDTDDYDPDQWATAMDAHAVSLFNGAPSAFYPLVDATTRVGFPYPRLRYVVLGGEPIRTHLLRDWLALSPAKLINSYGPTECTDVVAAWTWRPGTEDDVALPVGTPLANAQLFVTDALGRLVPPGVTGELRIAGVCVGSGYHGREDLTAAAFSLCPHMPGRWYATGDLVRYRQDGALVYVGRKDFQVKLRGLRIEPGEVDTLLRAEAGIDDALTLVRDEQLLSYVLSSAQPDAGAMRERLRGQLPEFMVPAVIIPLPRWPLTPNGKIDRKALPSPASMTDHGEVVAPRNDSEEALADIWCQVLKRDVVSVKASFFDIGGHSLLATQVISRVRQRFKVDLSVRAMFEAPTIEKMVRLISTSAAAGHLDNAPPIVPLSPPNRDTLSFAQYRLWFLDQLNQGSAEYNLPSALRIEGALDIDVLERVFREIVARHEVLRTRFLVADGNPGLAVDPPPDHWELKLTSLAALPADERESALMAFIDADAARPFNLAHDALFKTSLLRLGEYSHVLVMNIHHIIADGWSIGVLINEVRVLYEAFAAGRSSPLPPLVVQYADFALWQRQWLSGEVMERLRKYWLGALAGAPDVLRLPTDRPRPAQQTFNGAHLPVALGTALSARVSSFCDQHRLTPFMLLMGAYQILLSRHARQQDICVGTPIAGRNRAETEGLIGFFINGLIIRTRLHDNPSVLSYLEQVRDVALGAYAHQDMPIDVLADALKFERSGDSAPGAQVGFALQNVPDASFQAERAGLTITTVEREQKTAKYELTLMLEQRGEHFVGVAEYNTDLFDPGTIDRMMLHWKRLIEAMIEMPGAGIDSLELATPDELPVLLGVDPTRYSIRRLSPMQRDMYVDTLMDVNTLKNSLGYRVITEGPFDLDVWVAAAHHIAREQSLLRASLVPATLPWLDVAYLRVAHEPVVHVHVVDWSDRHTSDADAERLGEHLSWQPYDLHSERLTEHHIYKLDGGRWFLLFRGNHLLLDGAGMLLNLDHQIKVAEALKAGVTPPPCPDIFDQHAAEARQATDSHATLRHWRTIAANVEAVDFPLSPAAREAALPSRRLVRRLRLTDQHWKAIQTQSKAWGVHPAFYFKALYALLLDTYCRAEEDFHVSEVLGGRNGPHRRAYGNYFEVLPIVFPRRLFGKDQTIDALVSHVRHYRKQLKDVGPLSLLAQRRVLPQGRIQFMFNYYNFIASNTLWGTPVPAYAYPQVQDGPIQFVVNDQDGWLELVLIHLSDHFDDLRFLERMVHVSEQVLSGQRLVAELDTVLPDEQTVLAGVARGPSVPLEAGVTVVDRFVTQAAATPQAVAVIAGEQRLTYAELDMQSNQLARELAQRGVGAGSRVGICLDRGAALVVAILASLKAGAAYVPMDAHYPAERLSFLLEDSQSLVLLTQRCIRERLQEEGIHLPATSVLSVDEDTRWRSQSSAAPETRPGSDDLVYVIYTSGSTGRPKGAAVRHRGEMNLLGWYLDALRPVAGDHFLLVSAIGFDLTQKNIFAPLVAGATLVLPSMEHYDPVQVADLVAQHRIAFLNCAPSAFYPVVEQTSHPGYPFVSLRAVVLGGEAIRQEVLSAWHADQRVKCRIINSYGPTECSDVVASYSLEAGQIPPFGVLPIGRPVVNTRLEVVGSNGRPLPAGLVGELFIQGAGVGAGYLGREDLDAEAFVTGPDGASGWYRTGDLVRRWADGQLEYVGRRDFQVKLRGLRIELGEIDSVLRSSGKVLDTLVMVVDERLVAWVLAPGGVDDAELRQSVRGRLPEYMVPSVFVPVEAWPLTPNGKIDRKALPSPSAVAKAVFVAPRNDTEERIAAIWRDVLGVARVGVFDDFFELGGHSLLAARAVARFRTVFDVEIPLRALFEMHTIADIAAYLDTLRWAADSARAAASAAADVSGEGENRDEGWL
jgi:amino acid adenylation domain-containing protein